MSRLLALLLTAALVLVGCSGPEPSVPPSPTSDQATQVDPSTFELGAWHELVALESSVVLVNGYPEGASDPGPLELWRRDASGWNAIEVPGGEGARPSGRNFAAVAVVDNRLVLHGGLTADGVSDETWVLDDDRWELVAEGDQGPGPRSSASMALDEESADLVLYGGDDGDELYTDTWVFDRDGWTRAAPDDPDGPDGPDPVRWPAAMETLPDLGGVLLYGGHQVGDEDGPYALGDTWVWRQGSWREVPGATQPGPLVNAATIVHPAHGLLLLGGGDLRSRERGRVWRWTGDGWRALPPGLIPRRQAFGAAYDEDRAVVVLTGGLVEPGSTERHQDVWEWSGDPGEPARQVGAEVG